MTRTPDGTIRQSGLCANPQDYGAEHIAYPVVGVVLAVHFSDDPANPSAVPVADQRGSQITCDVMVIGNGIDNPWIVPNVVVLPSGPSGIDDFCEEIPRPCSLMIDGSSLDTSLSTNDIKKLDGDWCVVAFIGGSVESPVMMKWWPHPGNRMDPATAGFPIQTSDGQKDAKTLVQGRRSFRRYAGMKVTVTSQGSLFIDTNESNATFQGSNSGPERKPRDEGGDVQLDMKPARQMQVNFNEPVALPKKQPSLPQPNPPDGENDRKTDRTTLTLDKDTIRLLAGKICEILTSDDYIDLHAKTKIRMRGDDGNDSILLGDTDPSNCDHIMKGETFRDERYNKLVYAVAHHKHLTPMGPSDEPIPVVDPNGSMPPDTMDNNQLSLPNMVKK